MEFDFGSFGAMGTFLSGLVAVGAAIQLGLIILLMMVLFDLRAFLREGTRLVRRTDRFLAQREYSD